MLYNPQEPCNLKCRKCIWSNGCYRKEMKKIFKGERHDPNAPEPGTPKERGIPVRGT